MAKRTNRNPENLNHRIQPMVSEDAYSLLQHISIEERANVSVIVNKAIMTYAEDYYPQMFGGGHDAG